jgi:CBS domain-containing protein
MLRAEEIMTTKVITVSPDMEIVRAARLLLEKRVNGVPVVDGSGKLVGLLCQSDLIAQQKKFPVPSVFNLLDSLIPLISMSKIEKEVQKISAVKVADAMTRDPVTVAPDTAIEEVARLMVNKSLHTLPVVEQDKLVGIIGKEDVLRTLISGEKGDRAEEAAARGD